MPPQQPDRLLDLIDDGLNLGAHLLPQVLVLQGDLIAATRRRNSNVQIGLVVRPKCRC
jgi:hypothetical protein